MKNNEKNRLAFYIVCMVITALISIDSTHSYSVNLQEKPAKSSFYIDGTDFSPALDLAKSVGKGFQDYASFVVSKILVFFIALVLFCIFYFVCIRKTEIPKSEHKKYLYLLLSFFLVSFVICFAILHFSKWSAAFFINFVWALMALCFVILPTRKSSSEM